MIGRNGFWNGGKIILGYLMTFLRAFFISSGDVLFVTGGVGDSAFYRAYNPAEELRLHGFKCSTTVLDNPMLPRYAKKFKVFVLHRTILTPNLSRLIERIKNQGKEIIFDTDDLVYDPEYLKHMDYYHKMTGFEKKIYENGIGGEIISDPYVKVCTTTTSFLAEKLKEKGKKVMIVRNKFSNHEFEVTEKILNGGKKNNDGFIRVGYYSGTLSHNKDFASVTDALTTIMERYKNVKLVLAGPLDIENQLNQFKDRIETMPRVPRDQWYANIFKFDVNLAPLELDNPFCEAKSEIKFTEIGKMKIPTVAVRNRTFSEAIEDGADGFLADNTNEWVEKISRLIEDENLRRTMGERARQKVLCDYTNKNSHNEEYYNYLRSRM